MTASERWRVIDGLPVGFELRVEDLPRAPPEVVWARMTTTERRRAIEGLPCSFAVEQLRPVHAGTPVSSLSVILLQGDPHTSAVWQIRSALDGYFARKDPPVYLASNLPVYYPDEPMLAPDLLVVRDVASHARMRWVVSAEGRGLDMALEVIVHVDRRRDLERRVERSARLGIREYFVFDRCSGCLSGYRLDRERRHGPLVPRDGSLHSAVLGLGLRAEEDHLRFHDGDSPILDPNERIALLESRLTMARQTLS